LRQAVAPFTPERVAARADVPVEQINLLATWLAQARRPFVGSGTGPSMSLHSNLNDHMIETVNALVGGYKRAGDLVHNPGTLKPRSLSETVVPAGRSWEKGVKCRTADVGQLFGEFPTALLPGEILVPGPDRIRALIVFGGNPVMALGDPDRAVPAFEDLELLVSLDARMNETAALSHYVIATSQQFERHDVSVAGDALYPESFAQYTPPIVPQPPGTIHDWEFFWGVASRMQVPLTLKYWTYGASFDALPGGLKLDMERRPDGEDLVRYLCTHGDVTFEDLKANPGGVRPNRKPSYVQPAADNGARLQLCPADVANELDVVAQEESDTRFKYQLTCRRILEALNSAYRDSSRTFKKYPVNWAYMNPEDMQEEGIEEHMLIEIHSEPGRILGLARADARLRRGVLSMTHLYGSLDPSTDPLQQRGSHTGRLTSLASYLEPINFMPRFTGIPVNVQPATTAARAPAPTASSSLS
jgi:anaerobic selenocysteine-containing dehydrogenase